jgi:hypothetical protein
MPHPEHHSLFEQPLLKFLRKIAPQPARCPAQREEETVVDFFNGIDVALPHSSSPMNGRCPEFNLPFSSRCGGAGSALCLRAASCPKCGFAQPMASAVWHPEGSRAGRPSSLLSSSASQTWPA